MQKPLFNEASDFREAVLVTKMKIFLSELSQVLSNYFAEHLWLLVQRNWQIQKKLFIIFLLFNFLNLVNIWFVRFDICQFFFFSIKVIFHMYHMF